MSTKVIKKDPPPPRCITKQLMALKIGECIEYRGDRDYKCLCADAYCARQAVKGEKPERKFSIRSIKNKKYPGHVDIYCVKA